MKTKNTLIVGLPCAVLGTVLAIGCGGAGVSDQTRGIADGQGLSQVGVCGTGAPSLEEQVRVEAEVALHEKGRAGGIVTIPVYMHIITADDGVTGNFSDVVVANIVAKLNSAFAGTEGAGGYNTNFRFQLVSTDRTANTIWWQATRDSPAEVECKTALRQGSADDLNLYIRDLPPGLGGYGGFPWWYAGAPHMDGPVMDYAIILTAGSTTEVTDIAPHEVGHWMGLYHTFQDGCKKQNDYVADTPAQRNYTSGCPTPNPDTCTGGAFKGVDPIHNFMDYSNEVCMYQYTLNQSQRFDNMWATYRQGK
ncbi:MAG: zinc metalloprotease [Armatimonadetes bacterium]|nr:zinc metalloprotease [Armatimonadota bacterium]